MLCVRDARSYSGCALCVSESVSECMCVLRVIARCLLTSSLITALKWTGQLLLR
jgi:hypothetical protein